MCVSSGASVSSDGAKGGRQCQSTAQMDRGSAGRSLRPAGCIGAVRCCADLRGGRVAETDGADAAKLIKAIVDAL